MAPPEPQGEEPPANATSGTLEATPADESHGLPAAGAARPPVRRPGPPVAAVIFDVEEVIAHPDVARADEGLGGIVPGLDLARLTAIRRAGAAVDLWSAYSVGRVSPDAYWTAVLEAAGVAAGAATVAAVRDVMARTWWAVRDDAVLRLAARLSAAGLAVGLLSNSCADHEAAIPTLVGGFDDARFSHRTGVRKPAAEAYLGAVAALGVPPGAALFIDDKGRNVAAAEEVGLTAWVFRGATELATALTDAELLEPVGTTSGESATAGSRPERP